MKKELNTPLWIILLVIVSIGVVFSIVSGVRNIININDAFGEEYKVYNMLYSILLIFALYPVIDILLVLLCKKHTILLIPIGTSYLKALISNSLSFILVTPNWLTIVFIILNVAGLVVSIVAFAITKPLSKEKNYEINRNDVIDDGIEDLTEAPKDNLKSASLDDILKAKELLDVGAITKEEFDEIKRRALK